MFLKQVLLTCSSVIDIRITDITTLEYWTGRSYELYYMLSDIPNSEFYVCTGITIINDTLMLDFKKESEVNA